MILAQLQKYFETMAALTADCSLDSSKKASVLILAHYHNSPFLRQYKDGQSAWGLAL